MDMYGKILNLMSMIAIQSYPVKVKKKMSLSLIGKKIHQIVKGRNKELEFFQCLSFQTNRPYCLVKVINPAGVLSTLTSVLWIPSQCGMLFISFV